MLQTALQRNQAFIHALATCRALHVGATGAHSDAARGASTKLGRAPSEKAQRREAPNSPPARKVEAKRGVCGVAAFDNGPAIGCALRLASIPVWLQRIPRAKPDRLLVFADLELLQSVRYLCSPSLVTGAAAGDCVQ